jgi:glycine/serine hydroxymethyltransferase
MREVGSLIVQAIAQRDDEQALAGLAQRVHDICARFPVPGLPE